MLPQFDGTLIMDAGDLFFRSAQMPDVLLEQKKKIGKIQIEVYNSLGYQVFNIGGNDLAGGLEFVHSMQKIARFPFISANIRNAQKQLVFEPFVVLTSAGSKFGIIGVTSEFDFQRDSLSVDSPTEALHFFLPKLKDQCDYIILLACVDDATEKILINEFSDIDFLLRANTFRITESLEEYNNVYIARCGKIGKYFGLVDIRMADDSEPLKDVSKLDIQLKYTDERIESMLKDAGEQSVENFYADQPRMVVIYENLLTRKKELEARRAEIVNQLDFELIPLDENIPDDPAVRKILNSLRSTPSVDR
jgi:2',3'-cyclic-nucleotide 2'-phosphodiesterase (5'-nucleotidase family)